MEIDREMWAPAVASRKKRTMEPAPVATPATLCTLYAAGAGVATLALSVATFLTQPRRDEHYALPCVLLAIGLLLLKVDQLARPAHQPSRACAAG